MVTVSPDVASSTNLGGWINRVGIWHLGERIDWFADDTDTLVRWRESEHGQHIELGIAEGNLVGLLGELGATWSRDGQPLLPIGTLYDPFVNRALEPWSFGMYAGGQSILVGTPSGVTLAPEGGAHQSIITPSIGLEQPRCVAWEPAFGQDLEWALLHALSRLGRPDGTSAYFRLTTRPIDQALAAVPEDPARARAPPPGARRRLPRCGRRRRPPALTIVAVGAVMPEALAAADELAAAGIAADVVCLTSPDLVFRALQARRGPRRRATTRSSTSCFPAERAAPIVTRARRPPAHAELPRRRSAACRSRASASTTSASPGDVEDLYRHFGIDADTIVGAATGPAAMTDITTTGSSAADILVVGASGATGLAVVRALARRGAAVRALIRDVAKEGLVREAGAHDTVVGDIRDPRVLQRAVQGCGGVYFIGPRFMSEEAQVGRAMVDAAIRGGVRRFVPLGRLSPVDRRPL